MKTCTYDPLYRLLSATGKERGRWQDTIPWQEWDTTAPNNVNRGYVEEYEYDKVGFMTSLTHREENSSYQYTRSFASSGANHLASMTSGNNTFAFSHDESGNLTSGNGNHYYEWDYRNQLQHFYVAASSTRTKSVDAYYLYDSAGNRTKKFVLNQAGTEADITVYIGAMEIRYKKVIVSSTISSSFSDLSATIKIEEGGQCVATFQTGSHPDEFNVDYFTYSDHLGSSTLLIRSNGEIISREFYTPFGETAYRTSPKSRYRYCGKEKDGESGLYYYGARYYAAWLCRFVSVDPLAEKYAQLSSYNYCKNNPLFYVDPSGADIEIHGAKPKKGQSQETVKYAPCMEYTGSDKFIKKTIDNLNTLYDKSSTGQQLVSDLISSNHQITIVEGTSSSYRPDSESKGASITGILFNSPFGDPDIAKSIQSTKNRNWLGTGGVVNYNAYNPQAIPTTKGNDVNSITILAHELIHAWYADKGGAIPGNPTFKNAPSDDLKYFVGTVNLEELRASDNENKIRQDLNSPLRTHYPASLDVNGKLLGYGPTLTNKITPNDTSKITSNRYMPKLVTK